MSCTCNYKRKNKDDLNCQQEAEGATTTSSDDAKTGHSFDFLRLLASIDHLKRSVQDKEAETGKKEEKSRLPSSTFTAALTPMCIAKIKESLRQEQEKSNEEVHVSQPRRCALQDKYATTYSTTTTTKKSEAAHAAYFDIHVYCERK